MKILLIGLGGIGSYLANLISKAIKNNILDIEVIIADHDTVEPKNLLYQDYNIKDVEKNKAESIARRYGFEKITTPITKAEQLNGFDLIILAVDNNKTRLLVKESGKPFLDLRCKGTTVGVFTEKSNDYDKFTPKDGGDGDSCQHPYKTENKQVDYGNVVVAAIGMQYLNYIMDDKPTPTILGDISCLMLR